ncbi:TPA: diphthine--ammonia ligase [Candidatus Woesearchaeota archaeon]|nr:diphthine--ammonia ligase [Candidatus Woesearchaeota archaeon]
MCGIIGIVGTNDATKQVETALKILDNRGKDGAKIITLSDTAALGHTLHAIVGHVEQPLQKEGILTSNCEIYNWQELNQKYDFNAQNDAELLVLFLERFGITKLEELDGVFAFAYYKDNIITIARDLFGIKPVWYAYNQDQFAFASEKKALEKLGYVDIVELNPRLIINYDVTSKKIAFEERKFVSYLPEHTESYDIIKNTTSELLDTAIKKRIPNKKFGLLFSGGIDSTFLANYFKNQGYEFTCYTAVLDTDTAIPSDLEAAEKVAKELDLDLKIKKIKQEDIPQYLKKIVPLIEDSNVVKVGVALTFYLACEMAKEDGCKVIFSGLGSEEIFAGYERHKKSANINQECVAGLRKMYERDLYRDDVLTMDLNLELRVPFLDRALVEYALKIPEEYKIKDGKTKVILREVALARGILEDFAFRKKTAAQYGSRIDNALGKLAKKERKSKSEYLQQFYPTHNVKLGVLCSGGKDSLSAAYIMKQQNYELTCLITMRSENEYSYMFQKAGCEIVELQAEAMGIPLVEVQTQGVKEEELEDLERAIRLAKEEHKIEGIVTGALFSTYQRDRIETICEKLGLKVFSPLWHKSQEQHMREVIQRGFDVIITAVACDGLDESWLGRKIDKSFLNDITKITDNVAGEGGEFESLVLGCPLFRKKITLIETEKIMDSQYSGKLIIEKATLQ